jgi:hypothetical protein
LSLYFVTISYPRWTAMLSRAFDRVLDRLAIGRHAEVWGGHLGPQRRGHLLTLSGRDSPRRTPVQAKPRKAALFVASRQVSARAAHGLHAEKHSKADFTAPSVTLGVSGSAAHSSCAAGLSGIHARH